MDNLIDISQKEDIFSGIEDDEQVLFLSIKISAKKENFKNKCKNCGNIIDENERYYLVKHGLYRVRLCQGCLQSLSYLIGVSNISNYFGK